jgi:hypothetical protein
VPGPKVRTGKIARPGSELVLPNSRPAADAHVVPVPWVAPSAHRENRRNFRNPGGPRSSFTGPEDPRTALKHAWGFAT